MKKQLMALLSLVLLINSACFKTEAGNDDIFDRADADESFIELLSTEPDLLLEQYSNIIDIQTTTLSSCSRSNEGVAIEACEYDENGTAHFLEAEATLTEVIYREGPASEVSGDENTSSLYVLSANTKETPDSITKEGVTLNGCITWIDHFGMSNELVSLSGSRSGSYTGDGSYVCTSRTNGVTSGDFEGTSFSDSSKSGVTGYSFTLIVRSKSLSSGTTVQVMVKTSAFD